MYTRCLSCHGPLGANTAIEHFPVGRRLAFDAERGRLWVVCPRCARWNLSPLEERWEAIEACEREFRATPLRASTDHVGLTRLPEGLELVRVGAALGPELALWRYGRRFRLRRRAAAVRRVGLGVAEAAKSATGIAAVTSAALATTFGGPILAGLVVGGSVAIASNALGSAVTRRPVLRVRHGDALLTVRARDVVRSALVRDDAAGWALRLAHRDGEARLTGAVARQAAGALLTRVNHAGAEDHEVRIVARELAALGDPLHAFDLAADPERTLPAYTLRSRWSWMTPFSDAYQREQAGADAGSIARLPRELRLAMEMAAHEAAERRALEGELAELERAWREAEEIAAIADGLLLPAEVEAWLRRHGAPDGEAGRGA